MIQEECSGSNPELYRGIDISCHIHFIHGFLLMVFLGKAN